MEKELLKIRIKLEQLICRRDGFIAFNKSRESRGCSPGYGEDNFIGLESEMDELVEQLAQLREV